MAQLGIPLARLVVAATALALLGGVSEPRAEQAAGETAAVPTAAALFRGMVSALTGGAPDLRSLRETVTVTSMLQGQATSIEQTLSVVLPDKLRRAINSPMGEQAIVINGEHGFMAAGDHKMRLPDERIAESVAQLSRDLLVLVSRAGERELRIWSDGSSEVDGTSCRIIGVAYRGVDSRLCLDDQGRVLTQSYDGRNPTDGSPGRVVIRFSDYRLVDGVLFPFRQQVSFDGVQLVELTVASLEINPTLDPSLFELPSAD